MLLWCVLWPGGTLLAIVPDPALDMIFCLSCWLEAEFFLEKNLCEGDLEPPKLPAVGSCLLWASLLWWPDADELVLVPPAMEEVCVSDPVRIVPLAVAISTNPTLICCIEFWCLLCRFCCSEGPSFFGGATGFELVLRALICYTRLSNSFLSYFIWCMVYVLAMPSSFLAFLDVEATFPSSFGIFPLDAFLVFVEISRFFRLCF